MSESLSQVYVADNSVLVPQAVASLNPSSGVSNKLIGQSVALLKIVKQIEIVAPTDATVVILGETGTGKELIVEEIHQRSWRRNKPLVRVNCTSIPKELFESEFFGHAKGAFTGAKIGLGASRRPRVEPCSWTRSGKSLWNCRANYCAFCRRNLTSVLERR
jgi:transcriptional regulator with GAF, ATPase, and Fis domain